MLRGSSRAAKYLTLDKARYCARQLRYSVPIYFAISSCTAPNRAWARSVSLARAVAHPPQCSTPSISTSGLRVHDNPRAPPTLQLQPTSRCRVANVAPFAPPLFHLALGRDTSPTLTTRLSPRQLPFGDSARPILPCPTTTARSHDAIARNIKSGHDDDTQAIAAAAKFRSPAHQILSERASDRVTE